jgi:hypothetical protein
VGDRRPSNSKFKIQNGYTYIVTHEVKDLNKLSTALGIALVANFSDVAQAQDYQTFCYGRQGNQLVGKENCTVTVTFDHPRNGLDWRIVTRSGRVRHYRNRGEGIELWSQKLQKWVPVVDNDWFSLEDAILCWDDFCADWQGLPLD